MPADAKRPRLQSLSWRTAFPPVAVLALVACGGSPKQAASPQTAAAASIAPEPADLAAAAPVAALPAPAASALAPTADTAVETLAGLWRVEQVDTAESARRAVPGLDGRRMVRAVLEVSREQMNWGYRPDPALPGNDICSGPQLTPVGDAALRQRVAGALQRMGAGSAAPAVAGIDCDDGGRWGPGVVGTAYIARLGEDRMVMTWFDDSVLLLQRFKSVPRRERVETNQPLHASDYSR